ncbi:MAG: hypothetical protein KJP25_02155 [Gammaproteobacteria bacterium]|nr:hypothetical protein [Gammaproteobacteria bacterium]NND39491.1 hypothetical protein [Pseudomonadales bacterium]RZV55023.1 MAG: hypothetical protein EX270_06930 [Pseudomonadales bacterium]
MPIVHAPWWCLDIPDEWRAEEEEGCIVIVDPDEVGELCITVLRREQGEVDSHSLRELSAELREQGHAPQPASVAGLSGDYFSYRNAGESWREWFLAQDDTLVVISYCCDAENETIDAAVVDEMLETFVLADNSEAAETEDPANR